MKNIINNIICRLNLHRWSNWELENPCKKIRHCKTCDKVQYKIQEHDYGKAVEINEKVDYTFPTTVIRTFNRKCKECGDIDVYTESYQEFI